VVFSNSSSFQGEVFGVFDVNHHGVRLLTLGVTTIYPENEWDAVVRDYYAVARM
jgi:hypothetical protein